MVPRSDRATPLPVDVANELRDALGRRQKELPPRWLAALDAASLRDEPWSAPGHPLESTERALALALLERSVVSQRPRGVVCVRPSGSGANGALVERLCADGSVTALAAVELERSLATEMLKRLSPAAAHVISVAVGCDWTVDLPLPEHFPRQRVYLCLGNVLGSTTTVGAIRLLRVMRATMTPGDTALLGLDVRPVARWAASRAPGAADAQAARHLRVLQLLDVSFGAGLDPREFEFRAAYDGEYDRIETHLVARRSLTLGLPGVGDVRFRKGESIRTSVRCAFDQNRVTAMLEGVGLSLREWSTDPENRYAVALVSPAT